MPWRKSCSPQGLQDNDPRRPSKARPFWWTWYAALFQAQNCRLDVTQRSADMRAAFSRLAHASQVLHDPGVERAEFLLVEVAEIGWGDELRHEISPCAWAATIAEPSCADREQRVRQAAPWSKRSGEAVRLAAEGRTDARMLIRRAAGLAVAWGETCQLHRARLRSDRQAKTTADSNSI